jgi:hypothetical protein
VLLEEELTPLEEDRPLEVDEVDELDEVEVELVVAELLLAVEEEVPGMVAALTAVRRPTRPTAAKAAP